MLLLKRGELPHERGIHGYRCVTRLFTKPEKRHLEMADRQGGKGNFAEDPQRASEAGKKGGHVSGGNFKNDPERASEAGKKGGQSSKRN
jgi:general stress protein YciG